MKKYFIIFVCLIALCFSGCNKQIVDLTYNYNQAIVKLPNGEIISGELQSWADFEDGDQIQIKINGTTYLVHSSNVCLIAD